MWLSRLSIRLLSSAPVMISWFVRSSPTQTVQSLHRILFLSLSGSSPSYALFSLSLKVNKHFFKKEIILGHLGGSVHLTLAQIMISRFVSWSPMSGSVLTTSSLLRIILCLCLSLPLHRSHSVSVSVSLSQK